MSYRSAKIISGKHERNQMSTYQVTSCTQKYLIQADTYNVHENLLRFFMGAEVIATFREWEGVVRVGSVHV